MLNIQKEQENKRTIFIVGEEYFPVVSLEYIRALRNYDIYLFCPNQKLASCYSRYLKRQCIIADNLTLLNSILETSYKVKASAKIILGTTDDALKFLNNHRTELTGQGIVPAIPDSENLNLFLNKKEAYKFAKRLDIVIPEYYVYDLKPPRKYPIVIKPTDSFKFKKYIGQKIVLLKNENEYQEYKEKLNQYNDELLVMEYIGGSSSNIWSFSGFYNTDKLICYWTGLHKLLEYPENGTGILAKFAANDAIKEIGLKLLEKTKFHGVFEIDFKYNPVDGKYYFFELNPRATAQVKMGRLLGVNHLKLYVDSLFYDGNVMHRMIRTKSCFWVNEAILPFHFFHSFKKPISFRRIWLYFMCIFAKKHWFELSDPVPATVLFYNLIFKSFFIKLCRFFKKGSKKHSNI